jgi:hypothetical protein
MGDFNLGGLHTGDHSYQELMQELRLVSGFDQDIAHAWANTLNYDIDHSDLALEVGSEWVPGSMGTNIPSGGGAAKRIDYAFMVPPVTETAKSLPKQILVRDPDGAVWSRRSWPDGVQVSDHYPIGFSFEVMDMKREERIHTDWPHDVEWRVVSTNTAGLADCFDCDDQDVYAKLRQYGASFATPTQFYAVGNEVMTNACDDRESTGPAEPCTSTWRLYSSYTPDTGTAIHRMDFQLWDDDDTSDDDLLPIFAFLPGSQRGQAHFDWRTRVMGQRYGGLPGTPMGREDFVVHDYAPTGMCTQTISASFCWQYKFAARSLVP